MNKLSTAIFFLSLALLSLLTNSCKRISIPKIDEINSGLSKEVLEKIDLWLLTMTKNSGDSAIKNIHLIRENLKYENGRAINFSESKNLIIIPLNKQFKTSSNNIVTKKYFVLLQRNDGTIEKANVVELEISDQSSIVHEKLITSVYKGIAPQFNCKFDIYSIGSRLAYGLEYVNGSLLSQRFPLPTINQASLNNNNGTATLSCTVMDWFLVTYVSGVEVSRIYLYSTNIGDCAGGCEPTMIQCGSGDGSGGGDYTDLAINIDSIKKQLSNPCFSAVLDQITDPKLKSQMAKLFQQTYVGYGGNLNLLVRENPNLYNGDNSKRAGRSTTDPQMPGTWIIELNPTYGTSASKEFWASVIGHELVHSFITIYRNTQGRPPLTQFEQHEQIFRAWISQMRDFYIEAFGISSLDATSLAIGGIEEVLLKQIDSGEYGTFKNKYKTMAERDYNISLYSVAPIIDDYKTGQKGTTCN